MGGLVNDLQKWKSLMDDKWMWLPDFASDMGLWEDDLVSVSPAADHVFVPYEKMAACLENLYDLADLSSASTVVGWGLGAFALLKNANRRPEGQPRTLCPCSEHREIRARRCSRCARLSGLLFPERNILCRESVRTAF